jgi:hypothetical protein
MAQEDSLTLSQEPATRLHPDLEELSLRPHILFI